MRWWTRSSSTRRGGSRGGYGFGPQPSAILTLDAEPVAWDTAGFMSTSWHARRKAPAEPERNPIGGEYFSDVAIDQPAQALIRELLQNARDARSSSAPVRVRISVHEAERALSAASARAWFDSLWPHLRAQDSGVRDVAAAPGSMRFLVVEDFGTTGLTGDIRRTEAPQTEEDAKDERFFAFVRAEGFTSKTGGGAGSWGVGKTVFARSSDINTTFCFSCRAVEPKRVLIGQTTLKYRSVENSRFAPDVLWGSRGRTDDAVMPVSEHDHIDRFCKDFRVTRTTEPGLSIVVPALSDGITAVELLKHTIREYFLPILRGQMVIEVSGPGLPGGEVTLNDRTIQDLTPLAEHRELSPLVALADWTRSSPPIHTTPVPGLGIPTADELFADADAEALGKRLERGEKLYLRVRVTVRKSGAAPLPGSFDLLLARAGSDQACTPVYLRDSIRIPTTRERGLRGTRVHAIVLCEDNPLASMLRDAEGPGHTHWSSETQSARNRFKKVYTSGQGLIRLVEDAPRVVAERLLGSLRTRDTTTFADDFPMPVDDEERRSRRRKKRKKPGPEDGAIPPSTKPRAFTIDARKGGFIIKRADPSAPRPEVLSIRVAYDRTRGNPFKHYHPADFKLNQAPIKFVTTGCREVSRHGNTARLEITSDDFRIEVSGFDVHRDLEIDARAAKASETTAPTDVAPEAAYVVEAST